MFITLEGIEGSGKTTALAALVAHLEHGGHACRVTREPGGTPFGQRLRAILLDPDSGGIDPRAELLLYCADRVQHVRSVIQPALAAGEIVVCDRYLDATLAYQGGARELGLDLIRALHGLVLPPLMPDLTFLFDLDPRIGLRRAWAAVDGGERRRRESRFETEALAFHQSVRQHYLDLARAEPERFTVLDAVRSPEEVAGQMTAALVRRWPRLGTTPVDAEGRNERP